MRALKRPAISGKAESFLTQRSKRVSESTSPAEEAERLWAQRRNKTFVEIRTTLRRMCSGLSRCMYCEDSEGTDIDHFRPKSVYPESAFEWKNYLWACSHCNSNYKRDQFPVDEQGNSRLINPSEENPLDHLLFIPDTGAFEGLSDKGKTSVSVFGLSRQNLEEGRRLAWASLLFMVELYQRAKANGDQETARKSSEIIKKHPFSSMLCHLVKINALPGSTSVIPAVVKSALAQSPEIARWAL